MNYESLRKYKVGIYIKFHHMLRGKIFEKKARNHLGGRNPPPPDVTRVKLRLLGFTSIMLMIPWLDLFQIHVGLFNLDLGYTSIVYFLFLYWSFLELNTVFLVSSSHETSSFTIKYIDLQINRDFYNGLWNAVKENKKGKLNSIALFIKKNYWF